MTIEQLIKQLQRLPVQEQKLKLYVSDKETDNQYEIKSLSLFDSDEKHSEYNMLGIDY